MRNIRPATAHAATRAFRGDAVKLKTKNTAGCEVNSVRVLAPARLHFGLIRFGAGHERQFGGAGVVISSPTIDLRLRPARALQVLGPERSRVLSCVRKWTAHRHQQPEPKCTLEIVGGICSHVGLGSGTQLALAVATALDQFHDYQTVDPLELAVAAGRGQRSAVGTYGFLHGGFVAELGRTHHERIAPLHRRLEVPSDWRVLLIQSSGSKGLAGNAEEDAFGRLPSVPLPVADTLEQELLERMIPALQFGDFETFSDSVYRYGRLAGSCFAACQGSPFASDEVEQLVQTCRQLGYPGAGQSSWGPTVFAFAESEAHALRLQRLLGQRLGASPFDTTITTFNNTGAVSWSN